MDDFIKILQKRIDDNMLQLRDLNSKVATISTTQAVFKEHQNNIQKMYQAITASIDSVKGELYSIREKLNFIQKKQEDLEKIEIRRTQIWKNIIKNKTWVVIGLSLFVFTLYEIGAWLLNQDPPGKKGVPIELYRKIING